MNPWVVKLSPYISANKLLKYSAKTQPKCPPADEGNALFGRSGEKWEEGKKTKQKKKERMNLMIEIWILGLVGGEAEEEAKRINSTIFCLSKSGEIFGKKLITTCIIYS